MLIIDSLKQPYKYSLPRIKLLKYPFKNDGQISHAAFVAKDGADDGKISIKESFKHFVKGFISPIKMLFKDPKSIITGIGIIAAGAALTSLFPPILPALVAFGVLTGVLQTARGVKDAVKAKADFQAEKAYEKIGEGSFTLITSTIGAKSSLKAAGIEDTANLNIFQAVLRCFKEIPHGFTRSFQMAKNGTAWINLKSKFIKPYSYSDVKDIQRLQKAGYGPEKLKELKEYSEIIHNETIKQVYSTIDPNKPYNPVNNPYSDKSLVRQFLDIFPEEHVEKIHFRVKSVSSIKDKLIRKLTENKADKIKIESVDDARALIQDLVGFCLKLDKADDAQVATVVDSLVSGMKNKKIRIFKIDNYNGAGVEPYLNDYNADILAEAASIYSGSPVNIYKGNALKKSGYTTGQFNFKFSDGTLGEFQLRGAKVHKIASVEHIPYDLREGKDISLSNDLLKKLYTPVEQAVKNLRARGYESYNKYLTALYEYQRNSELDSAVGNIPSIYEYFANPSRLVKHKNTDTAQQIRNSMMSIMDILNIDNLASIRSQSAWLKNIPKTKFVTIVGQNSLLYPASQSYHTKKS